MASKVLDVAHGWLDSRGINLAGMLDYCSCCDVLGHLQVLHEVLSLWYASNLKLHCSSSGAFVNTLLLKISTFALIMTRFMWCAVTGVVGVDFAIPWGQVTLERYICTHKLLQMYPCVKECQCYDPMVDGPWQACLLLSMSVSNTLTHNAATCNVQRCIVGNAHCHNIILALQRGTNSGNELSDEA